MDKLALPSYAKVNYTLDVLSLRADGYHNLASVMQTISLADIIEIEREVAPGIRIECDVPGIPTDHTNLAFRAADAAMRAVGRSAGLRIRLDKRIPSQAGLGGGSSNAAYTLIGVNKLLELALSDEKLLELGAGLGSDVPFFLVGGTVSVRGRGESMTALQDGPTLWLVVVKPEEGVSTKWAFDALDAIPDRMSNRATRSMEEVLREGCVERIYARMTNDFEQVVFAGRSAIALLHDDFHMARARNSRLCGSGSAVFGVAYSHKEAEEIARLIRLKYRNVYVCRSITRAESLRHKGQSE